MKSKEESVPNWNVILIAVAVGTFLFLRSYISIILLSLLLAYIFYPTFMKLKKKMSVGFATTLTVFIATLFVIIPILFVFMLSFFQLENLVSSIGSGDFTIEGQSIQQVSDSISSEINQVGDRLLGVDNAISSTDVAGFIQDTIPKVLNFIIDFVTGLAASIPSFFAMLIIFLFLFTAGLIHHEKIVDTVKILSPFDEKLNNTYLIKVGAMTKAMLKGQMIIAIAQGIIGAASLLFLGLGDYVLFFAVVFSFLNLVPLGSGVIIIPLGIIAILTGNIWPGLVVLFTHFVITTNIDNILRPKLVPDEAHLPASLLILSAFAGVGIFGLLGVIYGPIIMIVITTTIEAYKEFKKGSMKLATKKAKA